MNNFIVSAEEYRHFVEVAKHINEIADDVRDKDQKKKFLMRNYPPTVTTLKEHFVREKFAYYFPYLVYYHEPDLCPFLLDTEDVHAMRAYLNELFKSTLIVKENVRSDVYLVGFDEYDEMQDDNIHVCERYASKLTPYEKAVYCTPNEITLERLQSTEPGKNIDRFLPFLIRFTEPSLKHLREGKFGADASYIRTYLKDCLFRCLDFKDDDGEVE